MPGGEASHRRAAPTSSAAAAAAEREEVDLRITRSRSLSGSSGNASLKFLPSKLPELTSQLLSVFSFGAFFFFFFLYYNFCLGLFFVLTSWEQGFKILISWVVP